MKNCDGSDHFKDIKVIKAHPEGREQPDTLVNVILVESVCYQLLPDPN